VVPALLRIIVRIVADLFAWIDLAFRPRRSLEVEILFLRRQLAQYVERGIKPRRIDPATRVSLALLSWLFDWRESFVMGYLRSTGRQSPGR
jgi:hypothetical protein